jgi:hypothetical protein
MTEEVKNVHREPHPFVGTAHMANFIGRTIAFVGKIESITDGELTMHQNNRKCPNRLLLMIYLFIRPGRESYPIPQRPGADLRPDY